MRRLILNFLKGRKPASEGPRRRKDGKLWDKVGGKWVVVPEKATGSKKEKQEKTKTKNEYSQASRAAKIEQYEKILHMPAADLAKLGIQPQNEAAARKQAFANLSKLQQSEKKPSEERLSVSNKRVRKTRENAPGQDELSRRKDQKRKNELIKEGSRPRSNQAENSENPGPTREDVLAGGKGKEIGGLIDKEERAKLEYTGPDPDTGSPDLKINPKKDAAAVNEVFSAVEATAAKLLYTDIYASEQIRKNFNPEKMAELIESVEHLGLLQPIVVRPGAGGKYEIIAGERRYRSVRELIKRGKWPEGKEIPVSIQNVDDRTKAIMQLAENFTRDDNKAGEIADFLSDLVNEHEFTVAELSRMTGKSYQTVKSYLNIANLAPDIRKELDLGNIPKGAASLIGELEQGQQLRVYGNMLRKNMNVKTLTAYVKDFQAQGTFFSDDEIMTNEMRAARAKLGNKSPEKLQQNYRRMVDRHQKFLNRFHDDDGSNLSGLALAATGDFEASMAELDMMEAQLARIKAEMNRSRARAQQDDEQVSMFGKSEFARVESLRTDYRLVRSRLKIHQFLHLPA